jgi:hypothetical protein
MWNDRYLEEGYAYGSAPNEFFKSQLDTRATGSILLPAEGEGRNAVYAASKGWRVAAFDQSIAGQNKALELAKSLGVTIDYQVAEANEIVYPLESFSAVGLIYAHFPAEVKSRYHKKLSSYLAPTGIVIFEAFSKFHLLFNGDMTTVGGPRDREMLFSKEEIMHDFKEYEILYLTEEIIDLNEGKYHQGKGSVIRFVGRKR